ncbi:ABC transporter substrate-binding protein [Microbaculum marinum]|uniref:ABC transporter substrate-binding protein n=1 Tax=Microbaculum marinum TaxID=1764581 RepID=A0AAW9RR77_9HYPH
MTRHTIMGLAAAMALTGFVAGSASAADDASIRLNWYLVGFHAPIYLGVERGYFADEGINLTINEGRGSGVATQVVGAKDDTFGLADAGTMILAASKGIPIKAVMSPMNISPYGVISRKDAGITTPKDLEGKRLAVTAGDSLTQLFPAVIAANGLDESSIEMVFVDPAGKVVSVLEKKADALLGSADAQFFQIEEKGVEAAAMNFADVGVPTVGITVIAHEDTIEDNPDLIRRFVKAMRRSFEEGVKDPDAAIAAAVAAKPDVSPEALKGQLMVDLDLLHTPASKDGGIGYAAAEDWQRTLDLMKEYRELDTDRSADSFYTNEFLPQQ